MANSTLYSRYFFDFGTESGYVAGVVHEYVEPAFEYFGMGRDVECTDIDIELVGYYAGEFVEYSVAVDTFHYDGCGHGLLYGFPLGSHDARAVACLKNLCTRA